MSRLMIPALLLALATTAAARPEGRRSRDATALALVETDRPYRVDVEVREGDHGGHLFGDLPRGTKLHPAYAATVKMCESFDPFSDAGPDRAEIDAYLKLMADTGPILEALHATGETSLDGLRRTWFGDGGGFEHVFCGETKKGGRKLGGFHFWYTQYVWERDGRARYLGVNYGQADEDEGLAEERIVTGAFAVDWDGEGGRPGASKKIGGFTVGHSPMVILALGHLTGIPGSGRLEADVNGRPFRWQHFRHQGSLRTLYPVFE